MKKYLKLLVLIILANSTACISQDESYSKPKLIGGCEGCEAIFEYGNAKLKSVDTLPDFNDNGQKIKISGIVYKLGGKKPAPNVILYVYHTNQNGIYENKFNKSNWERRHGYIRCWIKTNAKGEYSFYTLKPGTYPNRSEPAHIHLTILEPDGKYYWLNSYHFEGDPLLTAKERSSKSARGGTNGILNLHKEGDLQVGRRDIELGKNVPGYE